MRGVSSYVGAAKATIAGGCLSSGSVLTLFGGEGAEGASSAYPRFMPRASLRSRSRSP